MSISRVPFFAASSYAVVGASKDPAKFGNKVLRWYSAHLPGHVTPINPKETNIEGVDALKSISLLPSPSSTSLSIITPPAVTLAVLSEALALGFHALWLQPGSEDAAVRQLIKEKGAETKVTFNGPCILVLGADMLAEQRGKTGRL